MLLPLLLACTRTPDPVPLTVAAPQARGAGSIPARQLLWPMPGTAAPDPEALCAWLSGEAADDAVMSRLLRDGAYGFSLIEADAAGIRVSQRSVLPMTGGVVPETERRGMLISRLYDVLLEHTQARQAALRACGQEPDAPAPVLVAIDPSLSFGTARQILYTAGQAMAGRLYVLVDGPAGSPLGRPLVPGERQLILRYDENQREGYTAINHPHHEPPHPGPMADAVRDLFGGEPLGCGLIIPLADVRWSDIVGHMDAMSAQGAGRFILASGDSKEAPQAAAPAPPVDLSLTLQTDVPAFLIELPSIGPPLGPDEDPHGGSECSPVLRAERQRRSSHREEVFGDDGVRDLSEALKDLERLAPGRYE